MKKIIPFFLLILLLASCQKDPDMSKLDNDFVVYTNHDSKTDFKSFTTFYIPECTGNWQQREASVLDSN